MISEKSILLRVPNALSCMRFITAPLMLLFAILHKLEIVNGQQAFVFLYLISLLSDAADGFLARKLGTVSKLGARLDSLGDLAICVALPTGAYLLWTEMITAEAPYILSGVVTYFVPIIAGIFRYGRLPNFHTWGAKFCAVIAGGTLLIMFAFQNPVPFRFCVPLLYLEMTEELIMIAILKTWTPNVPSVWHALNLKKAMAGNMEHKG